MKLPEPVHTISSLIDKHHADNSEKPRPHMGCSLLGHPCDRWLWLSFRWAVREEFEGRILRLFRRGQMEEATIVSDLRAIGIDIRHAGDRNPMIARMITRIKGRQISVCLISLILIANKIKIG